MIAILIFGITAILIIYTITLAPFIVKKAMKHKHRNDAQEINEYILILEKNEELIKIIKNFVKTTKIYIDVLEGSCLPLFLDSDNKINFCFNIKKIEKKKREKGNEEEELSFYYNFLKSYDKKYIALNPNDYIQAINAKDGKYEEIHNNEIVNNFSAYRNLYQALINQDLIPNYNNKNEFYAFLFLIYKYFKIYQCEIAKYEIESFGLTINSLDQDIVKKYYINDYNTEIIPFKLYFIRDLRKNNLTSINSSFGNCETLTNSIIQDIKEKEKINNLLEAKEQATYSIYDVDIMSGYEFEEFITLLFTKLGYQAERTKSSGDQGIDVIAKKGNSIIAIQTKCFSGSVGNHAIMEAVAGMKYYDANKCMVITNSNFTKGARELANKNNVVLWNRETLIEKINEVF